MIVLDVGHSQGEVVARVAPQREAAAVVPPLRTAVDASPTPVRDCGITVHESAAVLPNEPDITAIAALLPKAQRVLEIGSTKTALQKAWHNRYGVAHEWVHCDDPAAVPNAPPFDILFIHGDAFDLLRGISWLEALRRHLKPNGTLWLSVTLSGTHDDLVSLLEGDSAHPTAPTLAPLLRVLMDAGWLPTLAAETATAKPTAVATTIGMLAADLAHVPVATVHRNLGRSRTIVRATLQDSLPQQPTEAMADAFTVVVPVTREGQLNRNVLASPGLREVGARVIAVRGATSPAAAWDAAMPLVDTPWVMLAHQDVYFPKGFGIRLVSRLAEVVASKRPSMLAGFAGVGINASADGYRKAGLVLDRTTCFDHPENAQAVSLDEFAVVMARDTVHRISPSLGWHLWATDLCLTAITQHGCFAHVWRLPVFHNSLNDYQLPQAFHVAAQRLVARHPDFAPIHTLCGTIDKSSTDPTKTSPASPTSATVRNRPPPIAPGASLDARLENQRFLRLDSVDARVAQALSAGDANAALEIMAAGVHKHYLLPNFAGRALYVPQLDRRIEQAAALLPHDGVGGSNGLPKHSSLLLATELYDLGGHSRTLLDLSNELAQPQILLTDLFGTYARHPQRLVDLRRRYPHAALSVLPPGTIWSKAQILHRMVQAIQPQVIVHLGHHQDPIPLVATRSARGARQILIHHADHNASLGQTLAGMHHVDLSETLQQVCRQHLPDEPALLPMYVPDRGAKRFAPFSDMNWSVVTSGHPAKFAREGPLALGEIVRTVLQTVGGSFHHIGPLDSDWVDEIRRQLGSAGINHDRFHHHGLVPSVWATLQSLDAVCYLGSCPVGGGRASIEAQGCGYPVVFYRGHDQASLLANFGLYASQDLGWATLDELPMILRQVAESHAALAGAAREQYLARFSRPVFQAALQDLLKG